MQVAGLEKCAVFPPLQVACGVGRERLGVRPWVISGVSHQVSGFDAEVFVDEAFGKEFRGGIDKHNA